MAQPFSDLKRTAHRISRKLSLTIGGVWHFHGLGSFRPMFDDREFERIRHVRSRKTGGTWVSQMFRVLHEGQPDDRKLEFAQTA